MEKLTVERSIWIAAPRERVWRAVTEENHKWFSIGALSKVTSLGVGGRISMLMEGTEIELAVIEVYDPPREFTTRELPHELVTISFLLEDENGGTRVTVIERGLERLSEHERARRLDMNGPGWSQALENLKAYADGAELPYPQGF